jgi:phosphinothricin acetyltransferase
MEQVRIREATDGDAAAIAAITNALIDTTTIEWTDAHHTVESRLAMLRDRRAADQPVIVADAHGEVVGWASYGDFRDTTKWPGYRFTVEHTVHVDEAWWGHGVGRMLVDDLVRRAAAAGVRTMVAAVDGGNEESVRFHERLGFVVVGRMPSVGYKHGQWLDLVLLQLDVRPE